MLRTKSEILANLIPYIILKITYIFDDLCKESELKLYGYKTHLNKKRPMIVRDGLPQGLSLSPLIATLAQERVPHNVNNFAYADDGIFFGSVDEFIEFMKSLSGYGAQLEMSKTKLINKGQVTRFCGVDIEFEKELLTYGNSSMGFQDPKLEE